MNYFKQPLSIVVLFIASLLFMPSCTEDEKDEEPTPQANGTSNSTLPSSVSGKVVTMQFTAPQTGAPYTLQQEVQFTFSSSGQLHIDDDPAANDGDEITIASFTVVGSEYIWDDNANGFSYALSLKSDGNINEVNVSNTASGTFLGQFIEVNTSSGNLVANYEGNYDVTSVEKGSHGRMTVSIDASGNIDFDTSVEFKAADFDLVSDRLSCCNGIWIDMKPYPTEPYPRVNLFVDASSGELNKIEYYPQYSGINNRVFVNLKKK